MNRIYQVIWSSVKNCYVVVSENASRRGKKKAAHLAPSTTKRTMLAMSLGVAVLMGSGSAAEAATGNKIIGGSEGVVIDAEGKKDQAQATGDYSTISGGVANHAEGKYSSVSGGSKNHATGESASISGGGDGVASGAKSSVSGGKQNKATGEFASVSGGDQNEAKGNQSTISGGTANKTIGDWSTIVGGAYNVTSGNSSLALGGMYSAVQGMYSVGIAGGSTSSSATQGFAAGYQSSVNVANGMALGYQAVAKTANTISFGHVAGDTYYSTDPWEHTINTNTFRDAYYNRLVNVADGIDDHDVVVMEQLKNAKAEAVAEAKTNIKVKGDEFNVHAAESTDAKGVQTTTISLLPKVTLKESTDTTGSKAVVLDGTAGTISAGLNTDTANRISLNGTTGLANIGAITIGKQNDYSYTYYAPVYDSQGNMTISSIRATESGKFITGLDNTTWTPGKYASGRAATEDQLEQAGRHFLSIKTAYVDENGNPITPVEENKLANYYNDGAKGSASMAFGVETTASGNLSLAMGVKSSASGLNSLSIGYGNEAAGTQSVAVGNSTNASGNFSVAMGLGAQAGTKNNDAESTDHGAAVAVGYGASAEETGSAAYGYSAGANAVESSAFGTSAQANKEGSVALGAHSVANREKGSIGYLAPDMTNPDNAANAATWVSTSGAVSLGGTDAEGKTISRQITNLAAGSEDSDAVNVAQLKAVESKGMNFQGNDTTTSVHLDQGGTLQLQGSGRKDDKEYSTQNVKVLTDTANNRLSIALDKNPDFDSVTAGTEGTSADGGQAGSVKIVGADSSNANKATTITAGYAALPELSGTKGTGRISYTDGNGTAHTVATLGDGLKFAGDTGTASVALDKTLDVKGGATDLATGNNIGVTANGAALSLKLAKDITGLDTVTAGGAKLGKQTDGNDTTKSGDYLTGLDNTTWKVGETKAVTGRAATEDQLKSVSDVVNTNQTNIANNITAIGKGLNFSASNKVDGSYKKVKMNLGDTVAIRANDAQSGHTYKTDNLTTEIDDNGIITVKMDTQLTADKVTVGKDGNAVTIDGSNGSLTTGSSTLNGTGLTIANGPSVTMSGISGGSKQITDVASGATRNDAAGKPVYETDTNGANIGDVKKIAAKMVTVSGDDKNTKVVGTPNTTDGTVDYKVSLNDTVTLGSDAGKKISLNGTTGVIKAGNQVTIDGSAGTASIGNLSLGTVAADTLTLKDKDGKDTTKKAGAGTYATGLTNTTWDVANPSYISGRAATEDELLTVSNTVNSGWKAQINGTDVKNVTPTDNTLNFVAGDNIELSSGSDIKISTAQDVNFNTVRIGGTNNNGTYTGGIYLGKQTGGAGDINGTGFYITGLENRNWDSNHIVNGRAATEDQLKAAINEVNSGTLASDNFVTGGTVSDNTANKGYMDVTLTEKNGNPVTIHGIHDFYVTGGSVSTNTTTADDGTISTTATLTLDKNNGKPVSVDLSGLSKMDYHLVENSTAGSDGKYTIDKNGDVKLTVASDTDTVGKEITISGLASKADVVKGLTFTASALADGETSLTHTAQLGDSIGIFGGNKQDGHTYNTNNITTTIDARGDIRVLMDDNLVVGSKDTGVDGSVKATGQGGAYLKMNGADGSLRMGDASGNFAALIQNYGSDGTAFLNSSEKGSPRLQYWAAKSGQSESDAAKTLHTIATLDDGMKFAGDDAKTISSTLNSTLNITGGAATGGLTDGNIGVVKNDAGDGLVVKLNKDLSNMGTISFAPTEAGKQGIKIGSQNVGTSGKGTNAQTGDYITGLTNTKWNADDIVSGRAATEDQLQNVAKSIVNGSATGGGFGLSADNADSTNATEVKQDLGKAIKITTGGDTNLSTTVDSANKAIVVALNKDLNLNKATFTDSTSGATTVIDGKGIAITPKNGRTDSQVKLTTDGLSNGGKQITNVLSGLNGTELAKAEGDTLNHAATIGDLQAAAKGVTDMADVKGLNFEGNTEMKIHTNLGDTLKIQGTGAADRDYDGGANVRVVADDKTNTLTVQLDRDLDAHTMTLGKESTKDTAGELGTLKINGQNKDGGISPVSINATYTNTEQDKNASLKTSMSRITYEGGNNKTHTVATMEDGLQLAGDNGENLDTTLNKRVTIKGGVSKDKLVDNTTDSTKNNNIGVVASQDDDGNTTLSLQLAKDITGLNTVTAGTVVMGNQTVNTKLHPTEETGNFVTGLSNTNWSGTDYVSGRAATEDQLYTVSQSIQDTVKGATFAITAGGQGEATDATVTKKVGESIRIFGDAPKVSGGGDGDGWDRSAANILTKVKKDNHGDGYVSVELQDHLEVGVHAGTDTDGKAIEGTDGSMQFKGKAAANEVMVTGDTGVTLKNNGNQAAALHQTDGTGYLDLVGSQGAFTSLFAQQGAQNLASDQDSKSDTRLTYTDKNSKTAHQVATLDDGLIVAGDNGQVTRLLNSTLKLSGGETDEAKLSSGKNIGVVANKDNDGLDIKLAKDLTDIDSINMTGGLKLNSSNGSSTITGLTNTSIDLPDFGKAGRAATEEQLEQVKGSITDAAKGGGFGLADDKGNAVKADLGSNIGIHGDSNITTAVSEDGKSLNIGLKKDVDLGDAGSIKAGGVTIDKNGIDAGGKNITNVKSGIVKGDDSDNGNAANIGDVKHIVDGKLGDVNGKIDNITKDVSNIKQDVSTIKQTKRTYQGDDGKTVNIDFGGALSLTGGATEVAEDKNIGVVKNGENGLSLRLAKNLGGLESVTTGKTTMDDSGLTIAGSDGKAGTTVTNCGIKIASSGDDTHAVEISNSNVSMGGQQIHGVAPGSADDDAVNVSQLKKSVGALGGAINQVDRRVDRVGAGAAALAALHPQDFDPDDKWDFAVGYGNYRGANAAAVGAFYKPNEDTTFSVGGTVGGGENMVNAGISFKFGQGNHVSNSRVAMAKEIKDLRKEVESLRSALVDVAAGKQLDPAKTKLFPDMPKNHWAYKEISELAGNGLLDGYPDGEFKGDRMMTRYEFATIVYRQMMAGRELSDRLVQEFEPELERIRIDVVARHKDGTPSIERVRVNKPADANRK
ncbi:ESPR-type extended signal peptide-containing protein [Mitsuokella multacida]|uniref:ESPR-type extended signal peptide-containing protein n=1 Tax=Mitsuokella multacida TaxID=52226 RepID=UPI00242C4F3F|nr:ESPR-type extended signal peptide-containing protein [Mitsuokella multacida]